MVLGVNSLFGNSAINSKEARSATVIVAADGSGDTDTVEEAIGMLPPNGGSVYIKEGTYVTSEVIIDKPNVMLFGSGLSTVLSSTANKTILKVAGTNVTLKDFQIYGAGAGNASNFGLVLNAATSSKVLHLYVSNCGASGIQIKASSRVIISNCEVYNCNVGISVYGIDATLDFIEGPAYHNIVSNNVIQNCVTYGIFSRGSATNTASYNLYVNNRVYDCATTQIYLYDANCISNLIDSNSVVTSTGGTIVDNGTSTVSGDNVVS